MAFHVEIQPQAFDDLDSIAGYIKARSSFATAEKWFNGIMSEIATLEQMPERCPIAPESGELPRQVRVLLHGKKIEPTKSISAFSKPPQAAASSLFSTYATGLESRLPTTSLTN